MDEKALLEDGYNVGYSEGFTDGSDFERRNFKELLYKLYLECEHGDEEHRKWLRDKFDNFYKRMIEP